MKTSLLTTLSFLLLYSTKLLLAHSGGNTPVLDIYNNTIIAGEVIYIGAANTDLNYLSYGFGLKGKPCPYNVVCGQTAAITKLFPIDGSTTVTESTNLVVQFYVAPTDCNLQNLLLWKINSTAPSPTYWPVVVGEFSKTDPETQFRIQEAGYVGGKAAYKFVYCPPGSSCHNLMLLHIDGSNRLFVKKSGVRPASKFLFVGTRERIKLVTSN